MTTVIATVTGQEIARLPLPAPASPADEADADREWAGFIASCAPAPDNEPLRALAWQRVPVMLSY